VKNKLEYYKFISDLSNTFLQNYDFDKAINKFLKKLAKKVNADRSYLFLFKNDLEQMSNTHEYCNQNIIAEIKNLQNIDTSSIQWWMRKLKTKKTINISNINQLPKKAKEEKKSLKAQGIKSILCYPFFINGKLVGFVGLDNVKQADKWTKLTIEYLSISTKIIKKVFEKEHYKNTISEIDSTLQATLELSNAGFVVIKKDGTILNHNSKFKRIWNLKKKIIAKNNKSTLPQVKMALLNPSPLEFEKRITETLNDPHKKDFFIAHKKDETILEISSDALHVKNTHIGRVWKCTDITIRSNYERKLQLISKAFEKSNDAILITDKDAKILETNIAFENITGYKNSEVLGKNPSLLKSNWHDRIFYDGIWTSIIANGYWEGEIWDRRKDGEIYVNKTFIARIEHEGKVTNYIGISKDITENKEYENKIKQLAYYDILTGLPNRTLFEQNLDIIISECSRYSRRFGLVFLDLDNFKSVNDTYGHLVGDKLLQYVANILQSSVRKSDSVSRLSGDEFVIIIKDLKNNFDVDKIALKILSATSKIIVIDGNEINFGVSIGISLYPDNTSCSIELLKQADNAMYNSKNNGKNRYSYFQNVGGV
jgi:diguanylate cyclase (GGDEF)-like protein/PAS domain S-box-containing protein